MKAYTETLSDGTSWVVSVEAQQAMDLIDQRCDWQMKMDAEAREYVLPLFDSFSLKFSLIAQRVQDVANS